MRDGSTEIGGHGRLFPETSWTLICKARGEGEDVRRSLDRLVRLYWKPVYSYVRARWHKSNEDAKDLTQEFFATFLDNKTLEEIREDRPRFRIFLRSCLEHFLLRKNRDGARKKRGGGVAHVPLDEREATGELTPEEVFDRAWARSVLASCLGDLEKAYRSSGREGHWLVFERYHLKPETATYRECAQALGISLDDVQNRLRHARRALDELVRERVRDTVASARDLDDELRVLSANGLGA
ncbi:sigma-70 family RNA polymerase sigma factor [bacterium]|nr:sigma-70 family RNA polymerase sigma factor [bacterium]